MERTSISSVDPFYTARGELRFRVVIEHQGLHRQQEIKGTDARTVGAQAHRKAAQWNEQWAQRVAAADQRESRQAAAQSKAARLAWTQQRTVEAEAQWAELRTILTATLDVDDAIDWSAEEDHEPFLERCPAPPVLDPEPSHPGMPDAPEPAAAEAPGCLGAVFDLVMPSRVARRQHQLTEDHEAARTEWAEACARLQAAHDGEVAEADRGNGARLVAHREAVAAWNARRTQHLRGQAEHNDAVAARRKAYLSRETDAVRDYCDAVLERSAYPDWNPKRWSLGYAPDAKMIVVDYELPTPDQIPRVKAVKYVASRDAIEESSYGDSQVEKAYDALVYQIILRTVHELFEADRADAVHIVVFNGRVQGVDRATGKPFTAVIASLQVERSQFDEINLVAVDPKACFKKLKGVGSSKLHSLAPVPPIVEMNTEDERFTDSYAVRSTLDEGENLAAMDWEDFEHLIRELFELEFGSGGGEVKVTRASRDGGIDVVVFDPDPLRGGKIVIQAKRYTNTVGVAAVRDLYGALQHEGAMKGILVTTSDYGPDAYEWVKDKPLTLINGAQLLHMLERHGHRVRINLVEARQARNP